MTSMVKVLRSADGTVINIGPWEYLRDAGGAIVNPIPAGAYEDTAEVITDDDGGRHERLAWLPKEATRRLKRTDYVIPKANETNRVINPEWKAWRQSLREIVGGLNMDIPPEPPRYGSAEDVPVVEEEVPAEPPVEETPPEDLRPEDLPPSQRKQRSDNTETASFIPVHPPHVAGRPHGNDLLEEKQKRREQRHSVVENPIENQTG